MHGRIRAERVLDLDAQPLALPEAQLWPGHGAVVAPHRGVRVSAPHEPLAGFRKPQALGGLLRQREACVREGRARGGRGEQTPASAVDHFTGPRVKGRTATRNAARRANGRTTIARPLASRPGIPKSRRRFGVMRRWMRNCASLCNSRLTLRPRSRRALSARDRHGRRHSSAAMRRAHVGRSGKWRAAEPLPIPLASAEPSQRQTKHSRLAARPYARQCTRCRAHHPAHAALREVESPHRRTPRALPPPIAGARS